MSIVIPPFLPSTISTQVWSDKEIIAGWKSFFPAVDKDPPVTDTWYDLIAPTTGVIRLSHVFGYQSNDETANKSVEVEFIKDGTSYLLTGEEMVDLKHYNFGINIEERSSYARAVTEFNMDVVSMEMAIHGKGQQGSEMYALALQVRFRNRSAAGTDQRLMLWGHYAVLTVI